MISGIFVLIMSLITALFLNPYPKKIDLKITGLRTSSFFEDENDKSQVKLPFCEKVKIIGQRFKLAASIPGFFY